MSSQKRKTGTPKGEMKSKSVYLPVSYWDQLDKIRKADKTRTNTKVIREAVERALSKAEETDKYVALRENHLAAAHRRAGVADKKLGRRRI